MSTSADQRAQRDMETRFPEWIRRKWASGSDFDDTKSLVEELGLHTVCQSAHCPNQSECWQHRTATFMVLGNICSRHCRFCSVKSGVSGLPVDESEPAKLAVAVNKLEVRHAVLTSVTRDDLPDGGAAHIAACIRAIHERNPETTIEVLVPDFCGEADAIGVILDAEPEVFSHNIETVRRVYPTVRDRRFSYVGALNVLSTARGLAARPILKSSFMVGLGESPDEVEETLGDLLDAGCEAVAIGQYLRPTRRQVEVAKYIEPTQFARYEQRARDIGFEFAVAGPFVRSSYRSGEMMACAFARKRLGSARRKM